MKTQSTGKSKMASHSRVLAMVVALGLSGPALGECQGDENPAVPVATPSERFLDLGSGMVRHRPTGLVWSRCAIGQAWTGSECSGESTLLDWTAALSAASNADHAGLTDWRLPNRNELISIIESRCFEPAINGAIFPDTPAASFWTSSPAAADSVWQVEFAEGAVFQQPGIEVGAVRLVRGGRM